MMNIEEKLYKYAELLVDVGINITNGKRLYIRATTDALPLVRLVTKIAYERGSKERISILKKLKSLLLKMEEKAGCLGKEKTNIELLLEEEFGVKSATKYFNAISSMIPNSEDYSLRLVCMRGIKDVEGIYIFGNKEELDRIFETDMYFVRKKDMRDGGEEIQSLMRKLKDSPCTFLVMPYLRRIKINMHSTETDKAGIDVIYGTYYDEIDMINAAIYETNRYIDLNGFVNLPNFKPKVKGMISDENHK